MPANSAAVVPTLATSRASIPTVAARAPYFCRMSPARPCPVTTPIRALRDWNSTRAMVETRRTQSSW